MSIFEQLVLDSLALNDRTNFIMQDFDPGIAPKRFQWISGADSDGAVLPEEAHYDNAEMTLRIRIAPQTSMDNALTKIGQIVDKLQECEQQLLGLPAVWTPNGSTKSLTAYVLGGEVTGIPITMSGDDQGWFLRNPAPVMTIKLYRRPFLYGTEVTSAATVTNAGPVQIVTVAGVTGDAPASARLVVTDGATQSRRHLEWGWRWRFYDAATALQINSSSLVTSGFAGTSTTRAGSVNTNVIRATAAASPTSIAGTGMLGHVGTYCVRARVYASLKPAYVRLTWQDGDGPYRSNTWVSVPVSGAWADVDLGRISVSQAVLGTQKWSGRIDAQFDTVQSGATTGTVDIDLLYLFPTERYGKARAVGATISGSLVGSDDFNAITAGTALNTRAAVIGGTWATAGSATDFAAADAPGGDETEARSTTSDTGPRLAALGATNYIDAVASVAVYTSDFGVSSTPRMGVVLRYVDASNYLVGYLKGGAGSGANPTLVLAKVIAGVETVLNSTPVSVAEATWYTLELKAYASGQAAISLLSSNSGGSTVLATVNGNDTTLATAGTLQTGKPGFYDSNLAGTAITRYYDNFTAQGSPPEAIVVYSGRAAEIRSDAAKRQDSTGTYYGDVPSYRGAHFFLQPAGDENRTNQIIVKARRNDIDVAADDSPADSTTVTIHYTPCWIAVPR